MLSGVASATAAFADVSARLSVIVLPLMTSSAEVTLYGVGDRVIPLDDLYTVLGNILEPDEIITEVQIPTPKPGTKQQYLKFRLRKAIDFAISSVAAVITTEAGVVSDAKIVLGGVAPTPYRVISIEDAIKGETITESLAETLAKAAVAEATPLSMNAYKVPITKALVKRAIIE